MTTGNSLSLIGDGDPDNDRKIKSQFGLEAGLVMAGASTDTFARNGFFISTYFLKHEVLGLMPQCRLGYIGGGDPDKPDPIIYLQFPLVAAVNLHTVDLKAGINTGVMHSFQRGRTDCTFGLDFGFGRYFGETISLDARFGAFVGIPSGISYSYLSIGLGYLFTTEYKAASVGTSSEEKLTMYKQRHAGLARLGIRGSVLLGGTLRKEATLGGQLGIFWKEQKLVSFHPELEVGAVSDFLYFRVPAVVSVASGSWSYRFGPDAGLYEEGSTYRYTGFGGHVAVGYLGPDIELEWRVGSATLIYAGGSGGKNTRPLPSYVKPYFGFFYTGISLGIYPFN